uniref:Ovule protein n=1 Tax=Steinernema glaseri TaxID=37863 RepID=A0A1I8A4P5_9BILA
MEAEKRKCNKEEKEGAKQSVCGGKEAQWAPENLHDQDDAFIVMATFCTNLCELHPFLRIIFQGLMYYNLIKSFPQ